MSDRSGRFVVFEGGARIAEGDWPAASAAAWRALDGEGAAIVLVFDAETGRVADLDARNAATRPAAKPGRPRLGVTAREVTLLPRHWDWLAEQPGGASAALRRLVEAARRDEGHTARARREAAYRFMQAMAGDRPGFEAASRALFAGDEAGLGEAMRAWPGDIADQVLWFLGSARDG